MRLASATRTVAVRRALFSLLALAAPACFGQQLDPVQWSLRSDVQSVMLGDEATASSYGGVESLPETLLIDRQGRIAEKLLGLTSRAMYEQGITELLRQ